MKTITLARRPLMSTVAKNVLEHGCGGLNIDASRISTASRPLRVIDPKRTDSSVYAGRMSEGAGFDGGSKAVGETNLGRWPANTVFSHLEGCKCEGLREVKGSYLNHECKDGNLYGKYSTILKTGHTDADGKETVANWICEHGCPVKALDTQSGIVPTGSWNRASLAHKFYDESDKQLNREYETWSNVVEAEGGASRYFKQVKDMGSTTIPDELRQYLTTMIDPSHITGDGGVLYFDDFDDFDVSEHEDESLHGLIVEGTPTDEQVKEMIRVLKPGGHIMLVAPDEQPTGHVGACALEDGGFEIRDSILYINSPEGFWYVPKASRSEREAGTSDLRVGRRIGNNHPTVKPYAIMEALLNTVPKDNGPVVDPFMGSGSTGVAALHTGHDFIGIEREEEYLKIADARIRHWDKSAWRGYVAHIESDLYKTEEEDSEEVDLSDLFGFGG